MAGALTFPPRTASLSGGRPLGFAEGIESAAAHPRRLDVQGLRAAAVLGVIAFHSGGLVPGGFTGVDVFFAISGFVITGSLMSERRRTGRVALPRFYLRRARRLLPALAVMLTFVACVLPVLGPAASQGTSALSIVFASVFAANAYLATLPQGYFAVSTTLDPVLHTWTLAVEEQFYLVFPVLLSLVHVRRTRLTGTGAAALAVGLGSLGSLVYAWQAGGHHGFYDPAARAWEFGLGALTALAVPLCRRLAPAAAGPLGVAGLGSIAIAFVRAPGAGFSPAGALLPVLGCCALVVAGTVSRDAAATRMLSTRGAGWIGDRSYSLYLWHWPLIVFAGALWPASRAAPPLAALAAFVPATVSFAAVERPFRRRGRETGGWNARLVVTCCAAPVLAAAVSMAVASHLGRDARLTSWHAARALHADVARGCSTYVPFGSRAAACTWHAPHASGRVVLFGDSNAGQFTEPVVAAGMSLGYDVTVATYSSCPYVGDPSWPFCRRFAARSLAALARRRPNLVIMAAATDVYLTGGGATRARRWERSLRAIVEALTKRGVPVVVIDPVPRIASSTDGCAVLTILGGTCGGSEDRRRVDAERAQAVAVERGGTAGVLHAAAIDLNDELCDVRRCSTMRNGVLLYRDEEHLSVQGARTLTDRFTRIVRAHVR